VRARAANVVRLIGTLHRELAFREPWRGKLSIGGGAGQATGPLQRNFVYSSPGGSPDEYRSFSENWDSGCRPRLLWPPPGGAAVAAQQQTFHLDRLEVPGAPDDGVVLFRPQVQDAAMLYGQLGVGLSVDPLRMGNITSGAVQRASAGNAITDQLSTYMSAGVEFLNRFTFGVTFPAAWLEGGQPAVAPGESVSRSRSGDDVFHHGSRHR
jgi:hypothetical protein